jgi:hypothetical protein
MFSRAGLLSVVFTLALVTSAVTASAAFAAKGRGGSTPGNASLTVNPNPATAYTYVQISGCGYDPGVWVEITVQGPVALGFTSALTDSAGCFSHDWWTGDPYSYLVSAYENASARKPTLMATTTMVVQ